MPTPIDDYLSLLATELRTLPVARRDEELREVRKHLVEAAATDQKTGLSDDDAMLSALEQFGAPDIVGPKIVAAWWRADRRSFLSATLCMTVMTAVAAILALTLHGPHVYPFVYYRRDHSFGITALAVFWILMTVAGWITGFAVPRRAVAATCWMAVLWYGLLFFPRDLAVSPARFIPDASVPALFVGWLIAWIPVTLVGMLFFGAPAVLAAVAGSRIRARTNFRRRAVEA